MSAPFVHLHCHSEYSILDGACRTKELVRRAAELEMPAVTVTDHGSMAGAVELYKQATKAGVKPIIGCEVYVVEDRRAKEPAGHRNWAHLTLLAESNQGYHNLIRLVTQGYLEGFHYKPRVDFELMERYADGIVALSGCLGSRVNQALLQDDDERARRELDRLVQIYGRDDVYVEIQDAGLDAHLKVNPSLIRMADDAGLPLVGSGDVHYLRAEDADPHDLLLCIQTQDDLSNPKRFRFENKEFYFKTPAEMREVFAKYERDLLAPTLEIAERCNVELELGKIRLPRYDVPGGGDAFEYLRGLCEQGLRERYDRIDDDLRRRLEFELQTIREMGFADYFLITWDFVAFAKREGIGVGPGRGSAAGSLVAYTLRITDVDPIRYDLLFERFLNPGRKSMPDIDIDFSVVGRERVMNYVVEKYGRERVAQIITFGKLAAKAATKDVGRVLGLPFATVDRVAKLIPEQPKISFDDCLKPGQELQAACDDPTPIGHDSTGRPITTRALIDMARPLEGLVRQDGIHAAAVVIGDRDLSEYVPLQRKGLEQPVVTQYAMGDIESLGLLKMDFLGLRNLDVIDEAVRLVRESRGIEIDISAIPLDDEPTYELLRRGDATGVFQFESSGMRESLRQVKPTEFEDLVALVALYRPGPMANIPTYAKRKSGEERVSFLDPRLEPILGSTKGVYIYQEQAMQIAKDLAGFSPADADDLRKAIGKKNAELMASLKPRFLDGCEANGVARSSAEQMWTENERSAEYSFNKSHAACYALVSYRTAYLKANYPQEYMAALISSVMDTKDRVPFYVAECAQMGIDVLPPDVNTSQNDFAVVEGRIRFGLSAVKGVGSSCVEAIRRAREADGRFSSIWDFCERVDSSQVNAKALDALIKAGAFDSTGATRRGALEVMDQALQSGRKEQADRQAGQFNIFDLGGGEADGAGAARKSYPALETAEFSEKELLQHEREVLGLFVSSHPLDALGDQLRRKIDCSLSDVAGRREGETVTVAGLVAGVRVVTTKKGDQMAFVQLEDLTGGCEVVVFANTYGPARPLLVQDAIVVVRGRIDQRTPGEGKVVAFELLPFEAVPEIGLVKLQLDARRTTLGAIRDLKSLVCDFPGDHPVVVELATSRGPLQLRLGSAYRVAPGSAFIGEVRARIGAVAVV